jgi:RimJ/RimL family protein N-acetyltransferase
MLANFRLRRVTESDMQFLWELRNDPDVRTSAFKSEFVEWENHRGWLEKKLTSDESRMWLLENEVELPVGQIRYDRAGHEAEIDYSVKKECRGKGCGTQLLQLSVPLACAELKVSKLVGIVKIENESSRRAFQAAGFIFAGEINYQRCICQRYEFICGK